MNDFPIKLIEIRQEDVKKNLALGGGNKLFGEVTRDLREHLAGKVNEVSDRFSRRFQATPRVPSVAKVKLKTEAIAKSHRPTSLFSASTCPIIGVGSADELLIEVTPHGLASLKKKIIETDVKVTKANITTLQDFQAYDISDVISNRVYQKIRELGKESIKVRLFNFLNHVTNVDSYSALTERLTSFGAELQKRINYTKELEILRVRFPNLDTLEEFADFGALRSLSFFQTLTAHSLPRDMVIETETQRSIFPVLWPATDREYPYVGVVDTGIAPNHPHLAPWVDKTENYVLDDEKNFSHGSFVGGIISYGDLLTGSPSQYDGIKLLDAAVIPNDDPKHGSVGSLEEDMLVVILQDLIPKYSGRIKVWNLSLGFKDAFCDDQSYSELAMSLDELQEDYDVIFVIPSGNYERLPIRLWPPSPNLVYMDQITLPADSLRAITVGSISHLDTNMTKHYEPSPFSRRGFGPNYTIKPELVEFGGTYSRGARLRINGVPSFGLNGDIFEDVGTSFSAPKVSSILAKLFHYLEQPPSVNLAKALLIHFAKDPRTGRHPEGDDRKYLGFGKPSPLGEILSGTESSATMVFEGTIYPTTHIEISDFPFPNCLVENGKCFGEINVTLVYNPSVDSSHNFEYCRSNIEVSLGTDKPRGYSSEVPIEKSGTLEKELVENGYKWSPIKVYSRNIVNGIADNQWKLKLSLQHRSGETPIPQDFALVITIRDPQGVKPVYNDVAQQLNQRFRYRDIITSIRVRNDE